jgi:lysophospholipase L1-like esterase
MRRMKLRLILRRLALTVSTVLAFTASAELIARLAESGPMSFYDTNPYLPDPVLGHVHKPDFRGRWDSTWYETNRRGWRGPDVEPTRTQAELRVVTLGDSCTFGKGVADVNTWPRRLETILKEELPGDRKPVVFNLGVNGYSSKQYLQVLESQGLALDPHVVVIGYNINDFPNPIQAADNAVFHDAGQTNPLRAGLRRWLGQDLRDDLNRSALYRFARATYYDWSRERDYAQMEAIARSKSSREVEGLDAGFEQEALLVGQLVERAQSVGAKVVIFLFPYESMVYLEESDRGPEERVRGLAERLGIGYIDVPGAFRSRARETDPPTKLFIRGDRYHPNERGYGVTARTVYEGLRDLGGLEPAK